MRKQQESGSYERLLMAAATLRGWRTNKEIMYGLTLGGLDVSPQKLCNWKSRGVAKPVLINVAQIIGCRGEWLQTGVGQMADDPGNGNSPAATPEESELLAGFRLAPPEIRDIALYILRRYSTGQGSNRGTDGTD